MAREHVSRCFTTLIVLAALTLTVSRAEAEAKHWRTVPGTCRLGFEASFPFGDFAGHSADVAGEFVGDPTNLRQGISGALWIGASTLRTGVDGRDRDMWRALEVDRYPEIRFTVQRVDASFPSVSDRTDVLLTVTGVMHIHGVERPMVFPGRVRLREQRLWVRGEGRLRMSDFGVKPPRKFLLQVQDSILVSFELLFAARD